MNTNTSRKIFLFSLAFGLVIFSLLFFAYTTTNKNISVISYAQEQHPTEDEIKYIVNTKLYNALLVIRDGIYTEDAAPLKYDDFINLENLNLSNKNLDDISGLAIFQFDNLKNLNVSNNNLTIIYSSTFYQISSLEVLDLSNNKITTIDFGNLVSAQNIFAQDNKIETIELNKLAKNQNLYLQNNKLNRLNLENLKNLDENSQGYINLINNDFTNMESLVLPTSDSKYIDFFNNRIKNANATVGYYSPHKINFVVQVIYENIEIDEKTSLVVFPSYDGHNYRLRLTHISSGNSQFIEYNDNKTLSNLGQYKAEVFDGDTNLSTTADYKSFNFIVLKSAPTFETFIDGEKVENIFRIYKPATLKFMIDNENYQIEYKVNNSQFISSDELTINQGGIYKIVVRGYSDNNYSKELIINIRADISFMDFWTIFIALISITAIIILVLILSKWIKK